jgi:hypothetical protein
MRILRKAGEDREPPLEYLVAQDARAALLRGDLRRAATDIEDIGHLANARNVAVHEGREMTDDELRPCLTTLTALLGKHEPASRRTLK